MLASLFLALYLTAGLAIVGFLLPARRPLVRIWMGLCAGLMLLMWLPALCAFVMDFTMKAHFASLLPLAGLVAASFLMRDREPVKRLDEKERATLKPLSILLIIFGVLSGYLLFTHTLRVAADGSLHVGQSTYGDLAMHLSFITSFVDAPFPPTYAMMKGEPLCYPFLTDSLSTSLYMGGMSLQLSVIVPSLLMMVLFYMGFFLFADRFMGGGKAVVFAFLLFFLNGGLGFLYTFDSASGADIKERLATVLTGFYKTPTNQPDLNLRFSNILCDLLVPQRTLLAGYTMLMPCLYLLFSKDKRAGTMVFLGVLAGLLPLVHTHSFLALGLGTMGLMVYDFCHAKPLERIKTVSPYLLFGVVAVALALPQLIRFTFNRTSTAENFMALHFNWSNNVGGKLRDSYLWFYLKNIGLPVILIIMALFEKNPRYRRMAFFAFPILICAEIVRFQPNPYDNNKLIYVWYLLMCPIVADYSRLLWQRLRGFRGRFALSAFVAAALFLSGGLTVAREIVSDYEVFSAADVRVASFVSENTNRTDTFLTGGSHHLNPITSLAGRTIPVSAATWLHYHGYNPHDRREDVRRFYEDPPNNADVLERYDIRYIFVGTYELRDYEVDEEALRSMYALIYERDGNLIFAAEQVGG